LIEFNGKRSPNDALNGAIDSLIRLLHKVNREYQTDSQDYLNVVRGEPVEDGMYEMETIYVPKNELSIDRENDINVEFQGIPTHMIWNMISNRLAQKTIKIIKSIDADRAVKERMVRHLMIAYKEPHPLKAQIIFGYQLPLNSPEFIASVGADIDIHKFLMNETIQEIVTDLESLRQEQESDLLDRSAN
jgi:hypothetical protein